MRVPLSVLLLGLVASPLRAQITQLRPADRQRLNHPVDVTLLHKVAEVPAEVLAAAELNLSDPSQPYQATDTSTEATSHLPSRRLLWAARLPRHYVIHYERGGRGHCYYVLLITAGPRPRLVWSASGFDAFGDYPAFLRGLRAGKLEDEPQSNH